MGKNDTALLDRVKGEVSDIKEKNHTPASRPVSYEPLAWTRQGHTD